MNQKAHSACAFAPATIANVAVGFDVLGFVFAALGDRVSLSRTAEPGVKIVVSGADAAEALPSVAEKNTAGAALLAMIEGLRLEGGFSVALEKGIPQSSGLGGSAASAVAAVVAANALLDVPLTRTQLLPFALAGEAVASGGQLHADNVGPCLFGGLTAVLPVTNASRHSAPIDIPVPAGLTCVAVCPDAQLDTKEQRRLLPKEVPFREYVEQSGHMTGFLAACFRNDVGLLQRSFHDLIVGPRRAPSVPGFAAMCEAAQQVGCVGCGIAGSGPTTFAWGGG